MSKPAKQQQANHFLQKWRLKLGYTQERAAELIGWTQSKVSRIENFDTVLTWGELLEAAKGYKRSPLELANVDPTKETAYVSAIDKLPTASETTREKVAEYVELLIDKETK